MKKFNIVKSAQLLLPLLFNGAHSWAVGFYSGLNCNQDASFNDSLYQGSGKSPCMLAGAGGYPGVTCYCYTNDGADEVDCDPPSEIQGVPGSAYFPAGTHCGIGLDSYCVQDEFQYAPDQCLNVEDIVLPDVGFGGDQITFQCYDVS